MPGTNAFRIDAPAARPHEAIAVHVHRHRKSEHLGGARRQNDAAHAKEAKDARHPGRPEIRRRVEVEVFHDGVGRAEEPAEERPHIGMEWHVEKSVRHIADSHERIRGEEPTHLIEGGEGEPKACHICGRIEAGTSLDGAARDSA